MDLLFDDPGAFGLDDSPPVGFRMTLAAEPGGTDLRVRLAGELDLCTAPDLAAGLASLTGPAEGAPPSAGGTVHLDLTDLSFLDSAGLTALRQARSALRAGGWQVRLEAPQPAVRRLLEHAVRSGWFPTGALLPASRRPAEPVPARGAPG